MSDMINETNIIVIGTNLFIRLVTTNNKTLLMS